MDSVIVGWGLSLNETLLVLACILLVIDIFFPTDIPTHIAYILLAVVVGLNVDSHFLYQLLAGIVSWFVLVGFHYLIWRKVLLAFTDRFLAPSRLASGVDGLVGQQATVKAVEGTLMASIQGDLWPFTSDQTLAPGDVCRVVSVESGTPLLQRDS
jgi:membrane protein implicated in regulation of membrane protease activity